MVEMLEPGETFVFAGQVWRLVAVTNLDVLVQAAPGADPKMPSWGGSKFALSTYLAKRVRRLALRSALAARAAAGQFAVLDRLDLEAPKTKVLANLVRGLGWAAPPQKRGGVLLITAAPDQTVTRSAANLPGLRVLPATALNVHDILACEHVLVMREALERITEAVTS